VKQCPYPLDDSHSCQTAAAMVKKMQLLSLSHIHNHVTGAEMQGSLQISSNQMKESQFTDTEFISGVFNMNMCLLY